LKHTHFAILVKRLKKKTSKIETNK